MKKTIIVGCKGQDGRILFETLSARHSAVVGFGVGSVRCDGIDWEGAVDIRDQGQVAELVKSLQADEIYYLAACHQSSQDQIKDSAELFRESFDVNVLGLLNFLEGIKRHSPKTRLFYASSSLIFEGTGTLLQDESTPVCPESIYSMTKFNGMLLCRFYRVTHGIFASTGILYNHESIYRRDNFISRKIIKAAVNIKKGTQEALTVGDLNAEIDWGYAPDYVEAMQRVLSLDRADDFIIASGEKHSVRDFIQIAFDHLGMDWTKYVRVDPSIMTRKRKVLVGNSRKLRDASSWKPTVDFRGMIKLLIDQELAQP